MSDREGPRYRPHCKNCVYLCTVENLPEFRSPVEAWWCPYRAGALRVSSAECGHLIRISDHGGGGWLMERLFCMLKDSGSVRYNLKSFYRTALRSAVNKGVICKGPLVRSMYEGVT